MQSVNYMDDFFFLNAGPTALPPRVAAAASRPMISHRGEAFRQLYAEIEQKAKSVFATAGEVYILTCSGSGGLEASVSNFIAPGEKVLVASVGNFGNKYRDIAAACGADVEFIEFPWGQAVEPQIIADKLQQDTRHTIKAVLFTQHETSTGVYNPVKQIAEARGSHPALLMADAISGLAACPLETDAWGIDVVIASSQKALMTPPGLCLMTVSERAWQTYQEHNAHPYLDLKRHKESAQKQETPTTPAVSLFYALNEALSMIVEKGLDANIAEHYLRRDAVRAALTALGLQLLAADDCAGGAITSFYLPEGITPKQVLSITEQKYRTVMCGGLGKLAANTLRFAHLGHVRDMDLLVGVAVLELALKECGYELEFGRGVAACQETIYAARS